MKNFILKSRYHLLLFTVGCYISIVVIEGTVTNRESRVYTFENPFFELQLNNIEEFESRHRTNR